MSTAYVGEIRMVGFNFAPAGWMLCQGQILSIAEYDVLFNLIGTTYGGNGQTTFNLPDLRGRIPVHMGTGPQGNTYIQGQVAGEETVTVQISQMPAHTHILAGQTGAGSQSGPGSGYWASSGLEQFSTATPNNTMASASIRNSGGSQPHDNMPPYLVVNFAISLFGVYPSRS